MAHLIYISNVSLDGCTEDEHGEFRWTEPDDEQFGFVTDLIRPAGTHLYGRRMYETMAVWETDPGFFEASPILAEFAAAWQDSDKVVVSTALTAPSTSRTPSSWASTARCSSRPTRSSARTSRSSARP